MQSRAQVPHALVLPALRRELVNDLLEGVQRAECIITGKVVLSLGRAAGDPYRAVIEANADVVLAKGLALLLGEGR